MMRRALALAVLSLAACVPYPGGAPDLPALSPIGEGPFRPLDPGAAELESLHFKVRAYGSRTAQEIADLAEANYNRIMLDTNLYSFKPRGLYELVVYGSHEEYLRKTGQPSWSGGATLGNAICTYYGPRLSAVIAHEMSHLIYHEFMGRADQRQRWLNEGLAVYVEAKTYGQPIDLFSAVRPQARAQPLTMEQMIQFTPASEKDYEVNVWYAQAQSLVSFMLERGGRLGFSEFLTSLRDHHSFDQAMARAFPAWRTLEEFDREWRKTL